MCVNSVSGLSDFVLIWTWMLLLLKFCFPTLPVWRWCYSVWILQLYCQIKNIMRCSYSGWTKYDVTDRRGIDSLLLVELQICQELKSTVIRRKRDRSLILGGASLWNKLDLKRRKKQITSTASLHSEICRSRRSASGLSFFFSSRCTGVVRRSAPATFAPLVLMRCAAGRTAVHGPALFRRVVAQQQLAGRLLLQPKLPDPGTLHLRRPLR